MALETTAGDFTFLVGRLIFGDLLAFMGLNYFTGLDGMSGYAETKWVPAPRFAVIVSGFMLVGGSLSLALSIISTPWCSSDRGILPDCDASHAQLLIGR